ncbi:hypothetical protein NLI96_g6534 [Meripilus lineatus]|uniref:Cytochrome c oxidase-assembly factor COX23, mitochondrial n=1 Tax=Meripilus lineatus TaxID=2056292 RepID=A0AAD5V2K6_9APHY|nr:hypothetical protein NLI96_g6534 [Physisporinus lineatus]
MSQTLPVPKSTNKKKEDPLPDPQDNGLSDLSHNNPKGRHVTSQFIDCLEYFQAYRDCKKAWIEQRKADRRAGRPSS